MLGTLRASWGRTGSGAANVAPLWGTLTLWRALARERRTLSSLDARMLRDIGIDPATAETEASRPFWDVPADR